MREWQGAYSLVLITRDSVIAVRDPWGFRPLSIGRLRGGGHAIASESSALQTIGGLRSERSARVKFTCCETIPGAAAKACGRATSARCTFEHIYFSRPDSVWNGLSIHHVRQRLGEELAREAPVDADVVVRCPIRRSLLPSAMRVPSGNPYNDGLIKNRLYRAHLYPATETLRQQGVALKFNALEEICAAGA